MFLAALLVRAKILSEEPTKEVRVIVLLADSMAKEEGADRGELERVLEVYQRSIEFLLGSLKMKAFTEVVFSSELEKFKEFRVIKESLKGLKGDDEEHGRYKQTQTAITLFMNRHMGVGVKVGWSFDKIRPMGWDEHRFDELYDCVVGRGSMQYVYVKAGRKVMRDRSVVEGCPYISFGFDYQIFQRRLDPVGKIPKAVLNHWEPIKDVCLQLRRKGVIDRSILEECDILPRNRRATIYNMLKRCLNSE